MKQEKEEETLDSWRILLVYKYLKGKREGRCLLRQLSRLGLEGIERRQSCETKNRCKKSNRCKVGIRGRYLKKCVYCILQAFIIFVIKYYFYLLMNLNIFCPMPYVNPDILAFYLILEFYVLCFMLYTMHALSIDDEFTDETEY